MVGFARRVTVLPGSGGRAGLEDHLGGLGRLAATAGAATESKSELVVSWDHPSKLQVYSLSCQYSLSDRSAFHPRENVAPWAMTHLSALHDAIELLIGQRVARVPLEKP